MSTRWWGGLMVWQRRVKWHRCCYAIDGSRLTKQKLVVEFWIARSRDVDSSSDRVERKARGGGPKDQDPQGELFVPPLQKKVNLSSSMEVSNHNAFQRGGGKKKKIKVKVKVKDSVTA